MNESKIDAAHSTTRSDRETRAILTPFAFKIDESLFGIPLSKPWKRLVAILIDLMLVLLLAETPGELLAVVIAVFFFRLGNKKRLKGLGKKYGKRRKLLRFIGAFIIFVLLISVLPQAFKDLGHMVNGDNKSASAPVNIEITDDKAELTETPSRDTTELSTKTKNDKANSYMGIEWFKGLIHDLGLSFGWAAVYFSVLTSIWEGQTPGKRLMGIRVLQLDGTALSVWDSFGRYGGYGAGLATGLLGFMQVMWDPNRQAIHDKISATIVVDADVKIHWKPKSKVPVVTKPQ